MSNDFVKEESGSNCSEQTEMWYVLFGLSKTKVSKIYVDHLVKTGKAKIKGPFTKAEILKYYSNEMINDGTILLRVGDREWKPYQEHKVDSKTKRFANVAGTIRLLKERGMSGITCKLFFAKLMQHKLIVTSSIVALLLCFLGYDYLNGQPERIYNRIKDGVVLITSEYSVASTQSLGSGFIVGKDGLLVTNFHVIKELNAVYIKTGDGQTHEADSVVYIDQKNDLAVLKLRNEDNYSFKSISFGDTKDLKIGEKVYAIGNPGGMEFSLSEGMVSGIRKNDPVTKKDRELIQITAPISPGNSGGPILDKKGRVIGVATLASRSEFQNINFAVPINLLGDYSKYRDIKYRFLSKSPDWVTMQLDYSQPVKQNGDTTALHLVNAAYDKKSITKLGSNRRAWFKAQLVRTSGYVDHTRDLITLTEVNCADKTIRHNIIIGRDDNDDRTAFSGFFDNDNWMKIDTDEKKAFDNICESGDK